MCLSYVCLSLPTCPWPQPGYHQFKREIYTVYPLYIIIIYLCLFAVWLFLSFPCRISSRSQDALMITLSDCASIRSSWTTLRPCGRRTRMRRRKLNEGCWLCSHLNQKGCLVFLFSSNHSCQVFSQRVVAAHSQTCLPKNCSLKTKKQFLLCKLQFYSTTPYVCLVLYNPITQRANKESCMVKVFNL